MNTVLKSVLTLCTVLIATELVRKFCPEDRMTRFVGSLVALSLLISAVGTVLSLDVEFSLSGVEVEKQQEELSSYVEEQVEQAAQQDVQAYVEGLLATAGLEAKEILVLTDRNEEGSIVLTEVAAAFTYPSEGERAEVLLRNVLGEEVRVTVKTDG
jgi:hypothetical protein